LDVDFNITIHIYITNAEQHLKVNELSRSFWTSSLSKVRIKLLEHLSIHKTLAVV